MHFFFAVIFAERTGGGTLSGNTPRAARDATRERNRKTRAVAWAVGCPKVVAEYLLTYLLSGRASGRRADAEKSSSEIENGL